MEGVRDVCCERDLSGRKGNKPRACLAAVRTWATGDAFIDAGVVVGNTGRAPLNFVGLIQQYPLPLIRIDLLHSFEAVTISPRVALRYNICSQRTFFFCPSVTTSYGLLYTEHHNNSGSTSNYYYYYHIYLLLCTTLLEHEAL